MTKSLPAIAAATEGTAESDERTNEPRKISPGLLWPTRRCKRLDVIFVTTSSSVRLGLVFKPRLVASPLIVQRAVGPTERSSDGQYRHFFYLFKVLCRTGWGLGKSSEKGMRYNAEEGVRILVHDRRTVSTESEQRVMFDNREIGVCMTNFACRDLRQRFVTILVILTAGLF